MPDTIVKSLSSLQLRELEKFGAMVNKFGANFAVCNADGEFVLLCGDGEFKSNAERLKKSSRQALSRSGDSSHPEHDTGYKIQDTILAAVLKAASGAPGFAALIELGDNSHHERDAMLAEMLELLTGKFQVAARAEEQIEMVGTQLSQVYEELVLLHKLSTNMKLTEADANYLQMACDSLTDIITVEGIAILLKRQVENEDRLVLVAGSGLIDTDEQMAAILYSRLEEEISKGKEALLDSEVDAPFRYDWPDNVKSIIAVPLYGKDKTGAGFGRVQNYNNMMGLMVAINIVDRPDFDSTGIKLFNSVANGCAVFIENGRLFGDLKELFIGSLKALTSSIDAKDPYTRGHSERVAFISRWIAERLTAEESLTEEQMHKIYLAGLLHDIGKIGIDDAVLRKKGKLTEQEWNCMKMHPSIGAGILSEIKQMRDVVPGVLCHHERVDGKGYPNGLTGKQMPLIGKIVELADSFDAMTSERTYRDAMTVEQAVAEIKGGFGTQFDEKVGRVFINSDIYRLWDIMQDGFGEIYGNGDLSKYGSAAVGTLIR